MGGRGSHPSTHYSWDPYLDQTITTSLPLLLNPTPQKTALDVLLGLPHQRATATGSFYQPTYSATAIASTSLTNTPSSAVLTVKYFGATTVKTSLGPHQSVTVTAQPGGTFTFTITGYANVTVTTTGSADGVFRLFGYGVGVLLGPLYGGGGPVSLDTPLSPGTYWVTSELALTSSLNTQTGFASPTPNGNAAVNPTEASASWGFIMKITLTSADGGGDG